MAAESRKTKQGSILIWVLIMLVALLMVTLALVRESMISTKVAANAKSHTEDIYELEGVSKCFAHGLRSLIPLVPSKPGACILIRFDNRPYKTGCSEVDEKGQKLIKSDKLTELKQCIQDTYGKKIHDKDYDYVTITYKEDKELPEDTEYSVEIRKRLKRKCYVVKVTDVDTNTTVEEGVSIVSTGPGK